MKLGLQGKGPNAVHDKELRELLKNAVTCQQALFIKPRKFHLYFLKIISVETTKTQLLKIKI